MEILLFTGYSASGKSTIAKELNKTFGFYNLGEREILHSLAVVAGFQRTREWLRHEGSEALIEAARVETVNRIKKMGPKWGVMIDGSYDQALPDTLKNFFPSYRQLIIHIDLDDEERKERMIKRQEGSVDESKKEMGLIDNFKRMAGVEKIMERADVVVDNTSPIEVSLRSLRKELARKNVIVSPFDISRGNIAYPLAINLELSEIVDRQLEVPEIARYVRIDTSRVLVVGTNYEVRELNESEDFRNAYQDKELSYTSKLDRFWEDFLGNEDFLNPLKLSIPQSIISTGYVRTWIDFAATVWVGNKLQEASQMMGISLNRIPHFWK